MSTSGRVVPTALAASPLAPLPLEAAVPLLVDQDGRLLVNVAASVPPPVIPPTTITTVTDQLTSNGSLAVVGLLAGLLYRVTLTVYTGAGFVQVWDTGSGVPGTGSLLCSPLPIPTTLPAYIDVEFSTINGRAFTSGVVVAVSTTAPAYTAPVPTAATGTLTASYSI